MPIFIVYFDLVHGKDYVYWGMTDFKDLHDHEILKLPEEQHRIFGKVEAGDLYPEYYILKINNLNDVAKTTLDEWVYFLKHDRIKESFSAKGLPKARDIPDYSRLSTEEQADYDYEQNVKSHNLSQIASAKETGESEVEAKYSKTIEEKDREIEELKRLLNTAK
ncbi:MAG: hypothetical protein LBC19_07675 [Tannerella sp.]|jgi:hypothetical protein|nr:hypothetical protein [Tannerella sp.]